jgi:hypothetical protein
LDTAKRQLNLFGSAPCAQSNRMSSTLISSLWGRPPRTPAAAAHNADCPEVEVLPSNWPLFSMNVTASTLPS